MMPNGTSEIRQYDAVNHLTYLENDGPSGVISSYHYTLAKTGRRDAVVEDTGRKVQYQYDALDRLIEEIDHRRRSPATGRSTTPTTRSATG